MGSLLVITGPPGAGKSTVAALVAQRSDPSVLVAGDTFFDFLDRGAIAPWLPEAQSQNDVVTRAAGAAAGRFASTYATVFDGVVGPWFLPTFAAATRLPIVHYVILFPTADVCAERVATRPDHEFTDEPATRKMHDDFRRAEIAERHVVRDPPATARDVADVVVERFAAGTLAYET